MKNKIPVLLLLILSNNVLATIDVKNYYEVSHTATIYAVKGNFDNASENFIQ